MKVNQFLHKYHNFCVQTKEEAIKEIEQLEIVEGHIIYPVYFPNLGWCLMLDTAYQTIKELEII